MPDRHTSCVWKIPLSPKSARRGTSFQALFQEFIESDAIPIGIYRKPADLCAGEETGAGASSPVLVTCPPAECMVHEGDEIYVIATAAFYSNHMEQHSQGATFTPRPTARSRKSTARVPAVPPFRLPADEPCDALSRRQTGARGDATPAPKAASAERAYSTHCPRGHTLKALITPLDGWGCDVCRAQGFEKDTKMWGCRKCRWVSCSACRKKNPDPELLRLSMSSRGKQRSSRGRSKDPKSAPTAGFSERSSARDD